MLSAFGIFWTGEGLGVAWPGEDLAIIAFAALFLAVGLAAVPLARRNPARRRDEHPRRGLSRTDRTVRWIASACDRRPLRSSRSPATLALLMPNFPLATGVILLFGCLGVLFVNVLRASHH